MKVEIQEGFPDIMVIIQCPQQSEQVQRIVSRLQDDSPELAGKKNGYTHRLAAADILYCETVDKHCFLYTDTDVYETRLKLYEIEERLGGRDFFRSAKSQIINIAKISSLCPDFDGRLEVVMENQEKLIVSRQYAKQLKERLGLK